MSQDPISVPIEPESDTNSNGKPWEKDPCGPPSSPPKGQLSLLLVLTSRTESNPYLRLARLSAEKQIKRMKEQKWHGRWEILELWEDTKDLTSLWNQGYRTMLEKEFDFLILANDDVVFAKNCFRPLMKAFEHEKCGIAGPMTNQPGHQMKQLVPEQNAVRFLRAAKERIWTHQGTICPFVNGFCMAFRKDRIVPFDDDHLFDPRVKFLGNEDEYQKRMAGEGYLSFAMHDAWVYHFKGVSRDDKPVILGKTPRLGDANADKV